MKHALVIILTLIFPLIVIEAQEDDPKSAALRNGDYYVEAEVSNATPYVGEQILYVFRYYAFHLPGESPETFPDFLGFWLGRIIETPTARAEMVANRQFYVGETLVEITPLQAGQLVIPPTAFSINGSVFRSGVELQTNSVIVDVRPLPSGAPESFSGAVGQFDGSLVIDRNTITLGEPLNLEWIVSGLGNLDLLPPPTMIRDLSWRIFSEPATYQETTIGGIQFGQKRFRWEVIPTQSGTQVFPSLAFSYFDPKLGQYRLIETDPIVVEVFPGADGKRSLADLDRAFTQSGKILPLVAVGQLKEVGRLPPIGFWLLWAVPPGLLAGLILWRYEKERNIRRRRDYRKTHALELAIKRIEQKADLNSTVYRYFSDKIGSLHGCKNSTDIERILAKSGFDLALRGTFIRHLAETEGAEYAPDSGISDGVLALQQQIIHILRIIDERWDEIN